jgi:hypothetical protein
MSTLVRNPSSNPAFEARHLTSATGWYVRVAWPPSGKRSTGSMKKPRRGCQHRTTRPHLVLRSRDRPAIAQRSIDLWTGSKPRDINSLPAPQKRRPLPLELREARHAYVRITVSPAHLDR